MKILILYVSANSGHQRAAMAIERAIRRTDKDSEIAVFNYMGYVSPVWEKVVTKTYFAMIKVFPGAWNRIYDHRKLSHGISPLAKYINRKQVEKFQRFLKWFAPDAVACTQAFPCGVVGEVKKMGFQRLRLIAVVTDFIAHVYWVHEEVDRYIVAADESRRDLMSKGVNGERIKVLGIPIDPSFADRYDRTEIAKTLGFSPEKTTVLIMGGAQGYGPVEYTVSEIISQNLDIQILIVAGTNEILREKLSRLTQDRANIKVFGFVTNISEIMEICDIIITKPGGLTLAESMARGLPMILTLPIPGQEEKNMDFFVKNRMAFFANTAKDTVDILKRLLADKSLLAEYKRNISVNAKPSSSLDIAKEILKKN